MTEPTVFDKKPAMLDLEPGTYWWCGCGLSASQPLCNGAHKGTGLGPMKLEIPETKKVALYNCKHSGNKPFCDGAHAKL